MAKNIIIPSVKGTREFYPEEMARRNFIYEKVREASQSFGYQEWDAPYLETLELYAAKSGEELVKEQAFTFKDRGGSQVTLRPELTPSLARMIAKKQRQLVYPLRWWSFGPFWRYERPQKGRSREFFQWNIDMLGPDSPEADAELIAVAAKFMKSVGLDPKLARIYVNNRRLMDSEFDKLEIPTESRLMVSNLVDRRRKMKADAWAKYALEAGITQSQLDGLVTLLENKDLWKESKDLVRLFAALDALGVSEYVEFDPNVVRGLLYYTGTVFEAFDVSGSVHRSLLGGGRYNNLLADVGGDPLSAVGFAMGDVVAGIVLEENDLIPEFEPSPAPVLVTVFGKEFLAESLALSAELRENGIKVISYPEAAKIGKQFKFANKMGVKVALVLGADEVESGQVAVKNLLSGEQVKIARADVPEKVQKILAGD
ncbi:MAG: histidine--tRNA ligase [Anaerolineae bacterium]|jgi:histidyl-tRNA synthetase|nr:histidine--tRNA ligase [Anaerolineae bacterium]MBT4310208.1 histidine--tRNA ligase [Anaerolineae bacterium]MBT4460181.1 histidine--tRNA ligase [Anaerolineae bacterium]MBT4843191.1 histidine--tRNA ligase [Anaerolineae bacterium]MBT6061926.1 histidine--tRNA ligase [Anaerolineae bacterium]